MPEGGEASGRRSKGKLGGLDACNTCSVGLLDECIHVFCAQYFM